MPLTRRPQLSVKELADFCRARGLANVSRLHSKLRNRETLFVRFSGAFAGSTGFYPLKSRLFMSVHSHAAGLKLSPRWRRFLRMRNTAFCAFRGGSARRAPAAVRQRGVMVNQSARQNRFLK